MHHHSEAAAWHASAATRRGFALFILVLAVAASALLAPAALAIDTYAGGPIALDFPTFIPNDHTVSMLRWEAGKYSTPRLQPSTTYYYRVVLSPSLTLSDSTSRGFTWNPATNRWVQERADWGLLPTITTDAAGVYWPFDTWTFFKVGDVRESGPYHLFILVRPVTGGPEDVLACSNPKAVTVTDPAGAISGAATSLYVHNGIPQTTWGAMTRAEARSVGVVVAMARTEENGIDENDNGVVDDEDYGPPGATGDFMLAVPTGRLFSVLLHQSTWPTSLYSYTGPIADVDIAWAVADQTAPSRVVGLTAQGGVDKVTLAWSAVPDADVAGYRVYRWSDPTPIGGVTQYTSQPRLIRTTTSTSCVDESAMDGETYYYHVRAVDDATNAGPRSATVSSSGGTGARLTLTPARTIVPYKGSTTLTVELADALGVPVAGESVRVQKSFDGVTWTTFATVASDGGVATTPALTRAMRFRARGLDEYSTVISPTVVVKPKVALSKPVAPLSVQRDANFVVYGSLKPRHAPGWNKAVKLYCYKLDAEGETWLLKKTAWCKTIDYLTYSRYKVTISLPSRGSWKLRAYAPADARHAATWSSSFYLKVK
jgi:hypothetical protein